MKNQERNDTEIEKPSSSRVDTLMLENVGNQEKKEKFKLFWDEIRREVISSNYYELEVHTKLPLTVFGFDDSDTPIYINQNNLTEVFKFFFEMPESIYDGDKLISHFHYFEKNPDEFEKINFSEENPFVRVENVEFEFQKSGKWLIVNLYMDVHDEFWNR